MTKKKPANKKKPARKKPVSGQTVIETEDAAVTIQENPPEKLKPLPARIMESIEGWKSLIIIVATNAVSMYRWYKGSIDFDTAIQVFIASLGIGTIVSRVGAESRETRADVKELKKITKQQS